MPKYIQIPVLLVALVGLAFTDAAQGQRAPWEVSAGAIFLDRDTSYDGAFVCEGPVGTGPDVIGENEVDAGVQAGFDLEVTRNLSQTSSVNTRFFFVDEWTADSTGTSANGLYICGSAVAGGLTQDNVIASFTSELYSAEINIVRQYNSWLQILAGFRWLSIDDAGNVQFRTGTTIDATYEGSVDNELFGFQGGANALLIDRGRFNVDGSLKAGIYGNDASSDGLYSNGVSLPLNDSDSGVAFVGEIGLTGNYQLSRNVWISAGYQLLWVDGIAILTQQPQYYNWGTGNGISTEGDALYHGAVVNLTVLLP